MKGEVIGFENIELISDRPFDVWIEELTELKKRYPKKMVIASIMEEYRREAWYEIVERTQATGVDGFELNLSCPHGLPNGAWGWPRARTPISWRRSWVGPRRQRRSRFGRR